MLFDARLHPEALTQADLETLRFFDVSGGLAVCDATAPHSKPDAVVAHFDAVLGQLPRLRAAGIKAWAALGVHPLALPRRGLEQVLEEIAPRCGKGDVAALGLVGLIRGGAVEEHALSAQLELAKQLKLPVFIAATSGQREPMTKRALQLVREVGVPPERVLVDGATAATVRLIRGCGHYVGLTLHPDHLDAPQAVGLVRRLGPERLVLASAAGDGASDIISVARAARLLAKAQLSTDVVEQVAHLNAPRWLQVRA